MYQSLIGVLVTQCILLSTVNEQVPFNACNLYLSYVDLINLFCCCHFNFSDPSEAEHFPMDVLASQNLLNFGLVLSMDGNDHTYLTSRLYSYDMTKSRVTLMAQHRSDQHPILVCTKLVEPFQAQVGSVYMVLGELEHQKGKPWLHTPFSTLGPEWGSLVGAWAWLLTQQGSLIGVNIPSKSAHELQGLIAKRRDWA